MSVPPPNANHSLQDENSDPAALSLRELLDTTVQAYSRFVPHKFLQLLGISDIRNVSLGQQIERKMTILFSDIRDFTSLSESMSPQENFNFLNSYLVQMEPVIAAHGGMIDKFIGDGIMALFPDSPDAALHCSQAMLRKLDEYNEGRARAGYRPIKIGIGINTGIVILGTVGGAARMDGTVIGDAVNLASRLERLTKEYRVPLLISEYTLYTLDDASSWSIRYLDRTQVRGKQDNQSVYEVFNADPQPLSATKIRHIKLFEQALAHYHLDDIPRARELLLQYLDYAPSDSAANVYLERCDASTGAPRSLRAELAASWRDEYLFGEPSVDQAHQNLLTDMNALTLAVHVGAWNLTPPLLDQIQFGAAHDFLVEEQLMERHDYPFLELHSRQHQRFFEYFGELREEIERGERDRTYLAFRVKRMLTDWLINHILNADRHFCSYLRDRDASFEPT
ncbi:MAG TPA: adenylate/guanylate cyclase domain-containing protein [Rhodocyclaceae bacterium]|nr:adenylate/guanylate cyclase domain-containing protein [Rhodocyclaceae bacterium]